MKGRILITGGAGFIGSVLSYVLIDRGYRVVILDPALGTFPPAGLEIARFGISHIKLPAMATTLSEVTAVVHLAAKISVGESVRDPLGYYKNNVSDLLDLFEMVLRTRIRRFIFASSGAVYGNPAVTPISEDADLKPLSPYGHTKAMGEQILRDVARAYGLKFGILRFFNVIGADRGLRAGRVKFDGPGLMNAATDAVLNGKTVTINGTDFDTPDGTCIRDYIDVADLADIISRVLLYLEGGGESVTLNCGTGKGISNLEFLNIVSSVSDVLIPHVMGPRREGDPAVSVAGIGRLRKLFPDFNPTYIGETISAELEWRKKFT